MKSPLTDHVNLVAAMTPLNSCKTLARYGMQLFAEHPSFDAVPPMTPQQCYRNAYDLAITKGMIYCEGYVDYFGVPIEHAWCLSKSGLLIEPTMRYPGRRMEYFGIPFSASYVTRSIIENGYYGVLFGLAYKTAARLARGEVLPSEFLHRDFFKQEHDNEVANA